MSRRRADQVTHLLTHSTQNQPSSSLFHCSHGNLKLFSPHVDREKEERESSRAHQRSDQNRTEPKPKQIPKFIKVPNRRNRLKEKEGDFSLRPAPTLITKEELPQLLFLFQSPTGKVLPYVHSMYSFMKFSRIPLLREQYCWLCALLHLSMMYYMYVHT
jgi:hypothetical protein